MTDDDERRRGDGLGLVEPVLEHEIFPDLAKLKDVPAIRAEAAAASSLKPDRSRHRSDAIVVVDHHQLAEAEVPSERRRLVTDALREASISGDGEDIVIEQVRCTVRNCASAIAMPTALATPWPSGPVVTSTPAVCSTGVAVADPLTEVLEVVEREAEPGEVQHGVLQN